MSDHQLPGNQSATAVTEVPAEGHVGAAQILAGVVEPDGEGNGLVLDEVLVLAVDVVDLGEGNGEGNLVWRRRREEEERGAFIVFKKRFFFAPRNQFMQHYEQRNQKEQ